MSTPEARCECCDLVESSCGKAVEQRARKDAAIQRDILISRPGWLAAQYAGHCTICYDPIKVGDPISRHASGGYMGACCG